MKLGGQKVQPYVVKNHRHLNTEDGDWGAGNIQHYIAELKNKIASKPRSDSKHKATLDIASNRLSRNEAPAASLTYQHRKQTSQPADYNQLIASLQRHHKNNRNSLGPQDVLKSHDARKPPVQKTIDPVFESYLRKPADSSTKRSSSGVYNDINMSRHFRNSNQSVSAVSNKKTLI